MTIIVDYTRDRYGRRLPRRSRDKHCADCGRNGKPARTIHFCGTGMLYDVCAQHEHEYCGTPAERAVAYDYQYSACIVPAGMRMTARGWVREGVTS